MADMKGALLLALVLVGCSNDHTTESPVGSPLEPLPVVDDNGIVPSLVCPGSAGCERGGGEFRAGVAVRSISPEIETWTDTNGDGAYNAGEPFEDLNANGRWDPVWLAGFGNGRAATGRADDLWARVLVFEKGDLRLAMVSLDLIGLFHHDVIGIRLAAQDLGFDHVMVATTHAHEGPDTMGLWGKSFAQSGYDPDYVQVVVSAVSEALAEAKANVRPATMRAATTQAPQLVNDTRKPIVIDQALTAMQFVDGEGAPIATAVVWGNHPEALGSKNRLVTSDYPHYLRARLEEAYPGAPAVFFAGSLGGLSTTIGITGCPDTEGQETCPQGTFERAEYVGYGAADAAIQALGSATVVDSVSLAVRRRSFLVSNENVKVALALDSGLIPRVLHDPATGAQMPASETKGIGVATILAGDVLLQSEVNLVEMGPLAIATVPGELYPELWLRTPEGGHFMERPAGADHPDAPFEPTIQSMLGSGQVPVVINNANDALGYIIPAAQWDEISPFAYVEEGGKSQYGEENSLGHAMASFVTDAFQKMMSETP
jgi:hypothetical protein